jgi:GNAT superfamily N-acetyltransferase
VSISIREARAGDAKFLARVVQAASRSHVKLGWFDIALARPEDECLEFVRRLTLTKTVSWCHWSLFLIAEVDGEPASALCRFRAGDGYPQTGAAMSEVFASYKWGDAEVSAIWRRGAYLFTCIIESSNDLWTIENVATVPDRRRLGLTSALLERALDDGRRLGYRRAQISFLIGNDPAERAYAKAGFEFASEKRHPDFEAACGAPGLRRFERAL